MGESISTPWRHWLAVFMLGIAAFTVVTTELSPIGMLSVIANDLQQDSATTGLTVTAYAWLGALSALVSVMWMSHWPRKPVLIALMVLLCLSNLAAAFSQQFEWLLVARLVGALVHGAFWAMIGTVGAQLVAAHQLGKATAIIFGGVSAASVVGVPLVNWLSHSSSWRITFLLLAALSAITALVLTLSLPRLQGAASLGRRQLMAVFANTELKNVYWLAALSILAHFTAFTFVEVLLAEEFELSPAWITAYLLAFGLAGLVGNFLCGIFLDQYLKPTLMAAILSIAVALMLLLVQHSLPPLVGLFIIAIWGVGASVLFVAIQTWVIRLAGDNALPASAIYASIFNASIGAGAMLGASISSQLGLSPIFLLAALVTLFSIAFMFGQREPLNNSVPALDCQRAQDHEAGLPL